MMENMIFGPMLAVLEKEDKYKHWVEMNRHGYMPLLEDKGTFMKDAIPQFPPAFQAKVTSVILTFGYTIINFKA